MNRNLLLVLAARDLSVRTTLTATQGRLLAFNQSVDATSSRMQKMAAAGKLAFAALAASVVLAVGMSTARAVEFDVAMRNVNSIAKESETQFRSTGAAVLDLAREVPQSATTLAQGLYDIASSGFQGAGALRVLEVSSRAATAGITTTEVAAKAVTAVINAYGLSALDAADVSDILFQTVNLGVLSFEELASQVGDVLGISAAAKVEFDEVGAALATMTLSGVNAAESATSLNQLIRKLLDPSEALANLYRRLGYESGAAALEQDGLHGVMERIRLATGGNVTALMELFPEIRAARGAYALLADEGQTYARVQAQITDEQARAGATASAFEEQMKALGNQWRLFTGRIEVAGIQLGTKLIPTLVTGLDLAQKFGRSATDEFRNLARVSGPAVDSVGDALTEVWDLLVDVGRAVGPLAQGFAALGAVTVLGTLMTLAEVLGAVAGFLADHPALVQTVALVYGSVLVGNLLAAAAATSAFNLTLLPTALGLAALAVQEGVATAATAALTGALSTLVTVAAGAVGLASLLGLVTLANVFSTTSAKARELRAEIEADVDLGSVESIREGLERTRAELDRQIVTLDSYGGRIKTAFFDAVQAVSPLENTVDDAADSVQQLADLYNDLAQQGAVLETAVMRLVQVFGLSHDEAEQFLRDIEFKPESISDVFDAVDAYEDLAAAASASTPATEAVGGAFQTAGDLAAGAADRVKALKDAIDALTQGALGAFDATTAWEGGIDALAQSVAENTLTFDANTEAGRQNREALSGAAQAAIDHAVATAEQTGNIGDGVAVLQLHRQQLINQMTALGMTRQAAEDYVNQLGLTPENIQTLMDLQAESANAEARQLEAALDQATRDRTVDVYVTVHGKTTDELLAGYGAQRYGGVVHARTGLLQAGVVDQPTVLFGERATGGEAFVPRRGNPNRSRQVLATAASWYGMEMRPRGSGTPGPITYDLRTMVSVSIKANGSIANGDQLVKFMRREIGDALDVHDRKLRRELTSR